MVAFRIYASTAGYGIPTEDLIDVLQATFVHNLPVGIFLHIYVAWMFVTGALVGVVHVCMFLQLSDRKHRSEVGYTDDGFIVRADMHTHR